MGRMIIGVDPHKASVTIEVVDGEGKVAATGVFGTDARQYAVMLGYVRQWPERVWAVEGADGAGRPLSQRLLGLPRSFRTPGCWISQAAAGVL